MRSRFIVFSGLVLVLWWVSIASAGQAARVILVLGNAPFIDPGSVRQATGAEVQQDPTTPLADVAVLVLANVALASLPPSVQEGLVPYVEDGGSLLITGGSQSFGSGGYKAAAAILPFEIRSSSDWRFTPFRPPIPLQPGHPILAGVTFPTVGGLNDMNPRPGATEILQSAGGGVVGGGSYPYPLIAEIGVGAGRAIGVAFDLNDMSGMRDRDLFIQNTLAYLLAASQVGLGR